MTNFQSLLKQAQKIQSQVSKMQAELADRQVEASAGGGMVTAVANGKQELVGVKIDPAVVDPDDVEMLEDLVLAAVAEAQSKARGAYEQEMRKATGGLPLNLPGLPKLF